MRKNGKIAFVFGRPHLNSAKLQYMSFALNTLKKLAEENSSQIDVYLTQSKTNDYKTLVPKNVNFIFLDKNYLWAYGQGRILYFLLKSYFFFLTFFKSYSIVWGVGQTGVVLGGKLAKRKRTKFFCLNDEFPNISYLKIWREKEKKYTASASLVILPDETRIEVLQKQVNFTSKTSFFTLPNIPLESAIEVLKNETSNWKKKLSLEQSTKIILYAGGITRENNIDYLLSVFPFTSPEYTLIMVGQNSDYLNNRYLKNNRIIWLNEPLSDNELHDLIFASIGCLCYYADFLDLEYVGKSSGKIMRSLLVGTPVITTNFPSLKFIETDGMGVLITKPFELINAITDLDKNQDTYRSNIRKNIAKYKFEDYWNKLVEHIQ